MERSPNLSAVFKTLQDMMAKRVISSYAVGGAVAAIFYIEPRETFDLDIFFILSREPSNEFLRLEAIYEYARQHGFEVHAEFVEIYGWAVQFLEGYNSLWKEAIEDAIELDFEDVTARVISPEYLAAMMVETGRRKDWLRLSDFLEAEALDFEQFLKVLQKHDLEDKWNKNKWRVTDDV